MPKLSEVDISCKEAAAYWASLQAPVTAVASATATPTVAGGSSGSRSCGFIAYIERRSGDDEAAVVRSLSRCVVPVEGYTRHRATSGPLRCATCGAASLLRDPAAAEKAEEEEEADGEDLIPVFYPLQVPRAFARRPFTHISPDPLTALLAVPSFVLSAAAAAPSADARARLRPATFLVLRAAAADFVPARGGGGRTPEALTAAVERLAAFAASGGTPRCVRVDGFPSVMHVPALLAVLLVRRISLGEEEEDAKDEEGKDEEACTGLLRTAPLPALRGAAEKEASRRCRLARAVFGEGGGRGGGGSTKHQSAAWRQRLRFAFEVVEGLLAPAAPAAAPAPSAVQAAFEAAWRRADAAVPAEDAVQAEEEEVEGGDDAADAQAFHASVARCVSAERRRAADASCCVDAAGAAGAATAAEDGGECKRRRVEAATPPRRLFDPLLADCRALQPSTERPIAHPFTPVEQAMLPEGFEYLDGFLTADAEQAAVEAVRRDLAAGGGRDMKRRVAHYGYPYLYPDGGIDLANPVPGGLPAWVAAMARQLEDALGLQAGALTQMTANEYTPGQGIAPHFDEFKTIGEPLITVSLLSDIVMTLECPDTRSKTDVFLHRRSAALFTRAARYGWTHGIPKRKTDPPPCGGGGSAEKGAKPLPRQPRVSLTFRNCPPTEAWKRS
eukprot:Rhum_TRINITY_DN8734_c0_g1::Rhum_TRINITY_DN8734_c0_g1_i1::g.29654::m.29654/K10770/ALKBH8; alkylated DNA repair protein alkB homolog 8